MAIGDPAIVNAVVTVSRNGVPVANMTSINVYIKPITAQNLDYQGVPLNFDIVGGYNPALPTSWHIGDVMHLESFPAAQVQDYVVQNITTLPIGLIPLWGIRIAGKIR